MNEEENAIFKQKLQELKHLKKWLKTKIKLLKSYKDYEDFNNEILRIKMELKEFANKKL